MPPSSRAVTARRSRSGSSGLTSQPSAPDRRARKTSGRRSSSISTGDVVEGVVGLLEPELEADGHAAHVAHLQVDDDQVGGFLGHHGDDLGSRGDRWTVMSGPLMTASTSRRRVGASLATRMVCTCGEAIGPRSGCDRASGPDGWPSSGRRSDGEAGGRPCAEAVEIVDVVPEERDPADGRRGHLADQVGVGVLLAVGRRG